MKIQFCFFALLFVTSCNPEQIGTWEGTDHSNQKISFIFKNENEVVLTSGNETVQGGYTIDESKDPNWIDFDLVDAEMSLE
jgi:hypothetical protein